jgi:hypothetical protein
MSNIVFISKHYSNWHDEINTVFNNIGCSIEAVYLSQIEKISHDKIIKIIQEQHTKIVLFDLEFSSVLSPKFLCDIKIKFSLKYIFMFLDDTTQWSINKHYAEISDLILTPQVSHRYHNLNVFPFFFEIQAYEEVHTQKNTGSNIKIAHYGSLEKGRKRKLEDLIEKGYDITVIPFIKSQKKLRSEISKYDVVINFSQAQKRKPGVFFNTIIFNKVLSRFFKIPEVDSELMEYKGRVAECLVMKVLCISEKFDSQSLYFPNNEMPTFSNENELRLILESLNSRGKYNDALKGFLSVYSNRESLFNIYLDLFDSKIRMISECETGYCTCVKVNSTIGLCSLLDLMTIRLYWIFKRIKFID